MRFFLILTVLSVLASCAQRSTYSQQPFDTKGDDPGSIQGRARSNQM